MEDFPLLILFFIIYLVASSSSGKKKKQKRSAGRQAPVRNRTQGKQRDLRARQQDQRPMEGAMEGILTAFEGNSDPERCKQKRMHLHEVSDEQMQRAAEGEDPCHAGGIQDTMDVQQEILLEEDAQLPLGRDVLRGVIMSEILIRPSERRALQRSRQRTNGY